MFDETAVNKRFHPMQLKIVLFSLAVLGAACQSFNDFEEVEIVGADPEFAVPIGSAEVSITRLLEGFDQYTVVEIDEDGLVRLKYRGQVAERDAGIVFAAIEDAIGGVSVPLFDTVSVIPFPTSDIMQFDYAELKSGKVSFGATNGGDEPLDFRFWFPEITQNGEELEYTAIIPPGETLIDTFDMTGYVITPQPPDFILNARYYTTNPAGEFAPLDFLAMTLNGLTFFYVEGQLGSTVFSGDRDSIPIEFFEEWTRGDVFFEEPTVQIITEMAFGLPPVSSTELFRVITTEGDTLDLTGDAISDGVAFDFPTIAEAGQVKFDTFTFNNQNSNIAEILGANPVVLEYKVDVLTDSTLAPNERGFIRDDSYFKIFVEVDLPLYGTASGFAVTDTFDLNFDATADLESAEFRLTSDNGLPVNINAQGYFLAADGTVLDSLFADGPSDAFAAAPVGADGVPTQSEVRTQDIAFPAARFERIREATNLALVSNFSTTDNGGVPVRIFAQQRAELRLGMRVRR